MSLRPSYSSNSTPDGSSVAAARRSSVLWESRRRLPDMPRTRMALRPRQLELDDQRHVVRERVPALGERRVPLEAELRAIDHRLEVDADLGVAGDVLVRADERAAALDRMRVALDGQLAVDQELVALDAHVARLVAELGVVLDVEEVRRLEVGGEVLVLDDDRVRVHDPDEMRRAVLADLEGGVEVLEAATEGRHDHVLDREARARVDLVQLPTARRDLLLGCYCHLDASVSALGFEPLRLKVVAHATVAENRTVVRMSY